MFFNMLMTLFFGEASMENVKAVKAILRSFEMVSGLRINFAKSQFGAVGQSAVWCSSAATYLNCSLLQLPFCYLGIPVGANPRRRVVWDPVIRKFEAKLSTWNQRYISMAGRITLINAVLTALPLFFLSFFRVPSAIIHRISAIQRQFLWGGEARRKEDRLDILESMLYS